MMHQAGSDDDFAFVDEAQEAQNQELAKAVQRNQEIGAMRLLHRVAEAYVAAVAETGGHSGKVEDNTWRQYRAAMATETSTRVRIS